jgi:hypothetical protein
MLARVSAPRSRRRSALPPPLTDGGYWIDPGTAQTYPVSFQAYRRTREAEERSPARHRTLGPDVDHYVWRRRHAARDPVDVLLVVRADAPYRIQRIVAEILRAIRRGEPAAEAIRLVGRRFGLRHARVRGFLAGCLGFKLQRRPEKAAPYATSF